MRARRDVGVALSTRGVSAWLPRESAGESWDRPLPPPDAEHADWPELASALAELRDRAGGAPRLHVAVLPPDAQLRCLDLPRMRMHELDLLLRRDLPRHFPITSESVAAAELPPAHAGGQPTVAATAPVSLLRAVYAAAAAAGVEIERIVPALAAWRAAALATWPALHSGRAVLVVGHAERFEVLQLKDGWPVAARRVSTAAPMPDRLREAIVGGEDCLPPVACVGDGAAAAVERCGAMPLAGGPVGWIAASVAAQFAARVERPELAPDEVRQRRGAVQRRWVAGLAAASLVCLAIAGALELWRTSRAAAAIDARRAAIRVPVSQAVAARDSATVVVDRLVALDTIERTSPRWSALVEMLAARLPDDAYLLSLRGEGDSASLDGIAGSAVDVITALRTAPGVLAVRADAPIRQELGAGGALVERFALTLRLARREAPPQPVTAARAGAP